MQFDLSPAQANVITASLRAMQSSIEEVLQIMMAQATPPPPASPPAPAANTAPGTEP